MSVFTTSTLHFSSEPPSLVPLDDTFTIPIETLMKAATIDQINEKILSRIVKQATPRSNPSRTLRSNRSRIVGKRIALSSQINKQFTPSSREGIKSLDMSTVPRLTKLTQVNDDYSQPNL